MHDRARLLMRVFNQPLMIAPAKLQVILHVLQPQLSLDLTGLALIRGEPPAEYLRAARAPTQPAAHAPRSLAVVDIMGSLVHRARGLEAESGLASYEVPRHSTCGQPARSALDPVWRPMACEGN